VLGQSTNGVRETSSDKAIALILLLSLYAFAGACSAANPEDNDRGEMSHKEAELEIKDLPVHGFYSIGSRWRFTGDEHDLDSYSYLGLDVGDPYSHWVTAHVLARSWTDVHRRRERRDYYYFQDIDDSYGRTAEIRHGDKTYEVRENTRLYYGYIDVHRLKNLERIRIGRQFIYEAPEVVYFDGGSLRTGEFKTLKSLEFCVYGGVPVHHYESSASGDSLLGMFVQAKPWPGGKAQLSFMQIEDRTDSGEYEDDYLAASVWQNVGQRVNLYARYVRLSDSDGDITARVTFAEPTCDLSVQASYHQLFEDKSDLAIDLDPYCSSLRELHPFWHARLLVHKGLGEHLLAQAGFEFRRLKERVDESAFNHEFRRYFATLSLADLPIEGLYFTLNGDCWDTRRPSGGDNWTVGGDIDYRIAKKLRASLGTAYSLYEYDYYAEKERDHIRTYYAGVKFWPVDMLMLGLNYDLEDDDLEMYHALKGELRVTF